MKKLLLIGAVLSVFSFVVATMSFGDDMSMSKAQTVHGWVSDSKCGAKGANAKAAECTKKCLSEGAKMVVVTDGDQKVLTVENPDALTGPRRTSCGRDGAYRWRQHPRGKRKDALRVCSGRLWIKKLKGGLGRPFLWVRAVQRR